MSDGVYSERKNAVANDTQSATTLVRVFLQRLSKKARNINGFRAFGKWHFSEKTVFQRLILGRFMF